MSEEFIRSIGDHSVLPDDFDIIGTLDKLYEEIYYEVPIWP